jgi:hypothetical protein
MIPYFVPLAMDGVLAEGREYTKILERQTEPVDIILCRTDGGEGASRTACQETAAKITPQPQYVIVADSMRVCCNSNDNYKPCLTNVVDAKQFLDDNPDYGAVSLVYPSAGREADDLNKHIDIGWVCYRYEVFASLKFEKQEGEEHYCLSVTRQIRATGKRFGYLDKKFRITKF